MISVLIKIKYNSATQNTQPYISTLANYTVANASAFVDYLPIYLYNTLPGEIK